ncbi:MAG: ATP-binding protein, partial [bacterium]|nr:ATP-binding protein [bacterium]
LFFFFILSEISQVFDNIFKNTYDALIEHWHKFKSEGITTYLPYIELDINRNAEYGIISIIDNGPGIKACMENPCIHKNGYCDNCDAFKIGRTTKETGTGVGMISVLRTLKKYKGHLRIDTSTKGTKVSVFLPLLEKHRLNLKEDADPRKMMKDILNNSNQ